MVTALATQTESAIGGVSFCSEFRVYAALEPPEGGTPNFKLKYHRAMTCWSQPTALRSSNIWCLAKLTGQVVQLKLNRGVQSPEPGKGAKERVFHLAVLRNSYPTTSPVRSKFV